MRGYETRPHVSHQCNFFFSFWLRARERLLISVQRSPTCPLDHSSHTQLIHYGEKSLLEVELPIPGVFFRWMSCHWPGEIAPLTKTLLNDIFLCNFSNINSIKPTINRKPCHESRNCGKYRLDIEYCGIWVSLSQISLLSLYNIAMESMTWACHLC